MSFGSKRFELAQMVARHAKKIAEAMLDAGLTRVSSQEHDLYLNLSVEEDYPQSLCFEGSGYNLLDDHRDNGYEIDTSELSLYAKNANAIEKAVYEAIKREQAVIDEAIQTMDSKQDKLAE